MNTRNILAKNLHESILIALNFNRDFICQSSRCTDVINIQHDCMSSLSFRRFKVQGHVIVHADSPSLLTETLSTEPLVISVLFLLL